MAMKNETKNPRWADGNNGINWGSTFMGFSWFTFLFLDHRWLYMLK
jgi:hypothetical protein